MLTLLTALDLDGDDDEDVGYVAWLSEELNQQTMSKKLLCFHSWFQETIWISIHLQSDGNTIPRNLFFETHSLIVSTLFYLTC